jgi:hypothetical protein
MARIGTFLYWALRRGHVPETSVPATGESRLPTELQVTPQQRTQVSGCPPLSPLFRCDMIIVIATFDVVMLQITTTEKATEICDIFIEVC